MISRYREIWYRCAPGFHMMGGDEAMETYEICMGANLTCMNDLMNRMGESKVSTRCTTWTAWTTDHLMIECLKLGSPDIICTKPIQVEIALQFWGSTDFSYKVQILAEYCNKTDYRWKNGWSRQLMHFVWEVDIEKLPYDQGSEKVQWNFSNRTIPFWRDKRMDWF